MDKNFLSLIGDRTLNDLFSDWQPRPIDLDLESWLDVPSEAFMEWSRKISAPDCWHVPQKDSYLKPPNFLVSQCHRVWLSCRQLYEYADTNSNVLDLGSYPFVMPAAMRLFFKHTGNITATVIQRIDDLTAEFAHNLSMVTQPFDLDPYVVDIGRPGRLPTELNIRSNSQDAVTLFHVVEHLYHPIPSLREAHRVLKPGGAIIISTDNAMMLNVFQNFVSGYGYIFEPVETTAAMCVHDWRGHVRFFTERDLTVMLEHAGFSIVDTSYREVFYDVFYEEFFKDPQPRLPNWKMNILRDNAKFRNDIIITAVKR